MCPRKLTRGQHNRFCRRLSRVSYHLWPLVQLVFAATQEKGRAKSQA
jgi:hypothetical protein